MKKLLVILLAIICNLTSCKKEKSKPSPLSYTKNLAGYHLWMGTRTESYFHKRDTVYNVTDSFELIVDNDTTIESPGQFGPDNNFYHYNPLSTNDTNTILEFDGSGSYENEKFSIIYDYGKNTIKFHESGGYYGDDYTVLDLHCP